MKLILLSTLLMLAGGSASPRSDMVYDFLDSTVILWARCLWKADSSLCLEERTMRQLDQMEVKGSLAADLKEAARAARTINEEDVSAESMSEVEGLKSENTKMLRAIVEEQENQGLMDRMADFVAHEVVQYVDNIFQYGDQSDNSNVSENAVEARGHKKKHLKKQNKKLKLILILMLIKHKIKTFLHKLQFLVQLKFLGIALANLLINAIRLWLELKKKHKPNKVIYYEKSHHQHHYDNEHIHDDSDDRYYSRPGSYTHHSHHEDESEGYWPWSRSYGPHSNDEYYRRPGMSSHNLVYMNQRPIR